MGRLAGSVLIPVRCVPAFDLGPYGAHLEDVDGMERRTFPRSPLEALSERIAQEGLPPDAMPSHWERLGDVVVLVLPVPAKPHAAAIGTIFGEVLGARTVVEDVAGIKGLFRRPSVRVLWGHGTETVHKEGGAQYELDVAKVMFSSGNVAERLSLARRIPDGAVVVDLFAGIGYFSIPIAVHARPAAVYACEINPVAYHYLLATIRRNRVGSVVPRLGDCRSTAPAGVADWVVMGHFDGGKYFDVAFRAVRREGTIVYHALTAVEQYPVEPLEQVRDASRTFGVEILGTQHRRIKSYAPGIVHAVVEASVRVPPKGLSGEPS